MINLLKNHISAFIAACLFIVVLIIIVYIAFFFNKTTIQIENREKLSDLMRIDFSHVDLTDIKCQFIKDNANGGTTHTQIFVFLKEFDEFKFKNYYSYNHSDEVFNSNIEHIPYLHIEHLKDIGIELTHIQEYGIIYNQIEFGFSTVPYMIHLYKINKSYNDKYNVVIISSIPRKVSINANRIIGTD